jgi:hypothetical protein
MRQQSAFTGIPISPSIDMTRSSLPIVPQADIELDASTHRRLEALAKRLLAHEPTLNRVDMFGPRVRSGMSDAPTLFFEDHSEISLFRPGEESLEYRSFLLTGEDDVFLVGGRRFAEFEAYCRDVLGIGAGTVLEVETVPDTRLVKPLALRCAEHAAHLKTLCDIAKLKGGLNIVPYIGTGNAWLLASAIAAQSGAEVSVAAAPPRLTRRVNDKLWFLERVREALDESASPLTYSAFGPAALAARIRALASRSPRVAVKVPDSAGSLGNVMIRSETIVGQSLAQIRQSILDVLAMRGWQDTYPLMVGIWDHPVMASPSVNVWVPHREDGPPIIEGVFTQVLRGEKATFVGAEPSNLPKPVEDRILLGTTCLAHYFQKLGYFGRCGFDAILVGDSIDRAEIHWIECNGRWGGVSIPITVANRLVGDWAKKSIIIVQRTRLQMPPRSLEAVLERLKGYLFSPANSHEGVVLLAPARLIDGSGLNVMVIADTRSSAEGYLEAVMGLLEVDQEGRTH